SVGTPSEIAVAKKLLMSRAFVKELEDAVEELPERPISQHPNLVTAEGLAHIEAEVTRRSTPPPRRRTTAPRWRARRATCATGPPGGRAHSSSLRPAIEARCISARR